MPPRKSTKRKHDIDEAEGSVNEQILAVLRSIDARLGRIERQGQLGSRQPQSNRLRDASSSTIPIVPGSWKFKYSSSLESSLKSIHDQRHGNSRRARAPPPVPTSAFGKVSEEGLVLIGEEYVGPSSSAGLFTRGFIHPAGGRGQSWTDGLYSGISDSDMTPRWVNDLSESNFGTRNLLARLVFNDKKELDHKSGIYTLTIKYNVSLGNNDQDAAIIIGEMEFHSEGHAIAEGADWDRLLNNQRQTQLPYSRGARGVATWQSRKISEQWVDGDELKFKIDTNENTIVFRKGNKPAKTFWNVLAFTNNPKYPEYLHAFAYCGGPKGTKEIDVKLTIIP